MPKRHRLAPPEIVERCALLERTVEDLELKYATLVWDWISLKTDVEASQKPGPGKHRRTADSW